MSDIVEQSQEISEWSTDTNVQHEERPAVTKRRSESVTALMMYMELSKIIPWYAKPSSPSIIQEAKKTIKKGSKEKPVGKIICF